MLPKRKGGYGIHPYGFDCYLQINAVGEDIILPSFIKVSLRITRAVGDACPYRFLINDK